MTEDLITWDNLTEKLSTAIATEANEKDLVFSAIQLIRNAARSDSRKKKTTVAYDAYCVAGNAWENAMDSMRHIDRVDDPSYKIVYPLLVERDDLSYQITINLRKYCDSPQTSIIWCLFQTIDTKIWQRYLDEVWDALSKLEVYTKNSVALCVSKTSCNCGWLDERYNDRALRIAFEMLTVSDWDRYTTDFLDCEY